MVSHGKDRSLDVTFIYKIRGILVILVGSVLGLMASLGAHLLHDRQARGELERNARQTEQVRVIAEVLERIREEYVDSLDDETLVENAIKGMLEDLDDYSRFLGEDDYEDIRISTTAPEERSRSPSMT